MQFLKDCFKVGYRKTRKDVLGIVQSVASEKGLLKSAIVTEGRWRSFLERQGDLLLRRGTALLTSVWMLSTKSMGHYFSLLHDTLTTHDVLSKPSQIYNVRLFGEVIAEQQTTRRSYVLYHGLAVHSDCMCCTAKKDGSTYRGRKFPEIYTA